MDKLVKFYARPHGGYIHSSLKCSMLAGAVFEELGYEEIVLEEAQKRGLSLCSCVYETLDSNRYLTASGLIETLARKEKLG